MSLNSSVSSIGLDYAATTLLIGLSQERHYGENSASMQIVRRALVEAPAAPAVNQASTAPTEEQRRAAMQAHFAYLSTLNPPHWRRE